MLRHQRALDSLARDGQLDVYQCYPMDRTANRYLEQGFEMNKPEVTTTFRIVSMHSGNKQYWSDQGQKFVDDESVARVYISADCALTDWSRLKKYSVAIECTTVTKHLVRSHE